MVLILIEMVTVLPVNKKFLTILLSISLLLLAFLFLIVRKKEVNTPTTYKEAIQYVQKVSLSDIRSKIKNKEKFTLFIGRESCPYCQKFAPKLAVAIQKCNKIVYYLDNDSSERKEITKFAHDLDVKTVPNLSNFVHGSKVNQLDKGSKASVEEILDFITKE